MIYREAMPLSWKAKTGVLWEKNRCFEAFLLDSNEKSIIEYVSE